MYGKTDILMCLQMADNLIYAFRSTISWTGTMKLKYEMQALMAPYKEVHKVKKNNAKQMTTSATSN